ncbi:MAG: NUDIX hydrolase [Blastocatellia bacterium]|nr:NUDIX hydrolase [Blastocatellia bacterium]
MSASQKEKLAAGGVVIDESDDGALRVLVVHRPRYDDWSFPKGGVDQGETLEQAALREVREETGLECRIIRKLSSVSYSYPTRKGDRPKVVHYFLMEPSGRTFDIEGDEVDRAEWLSVDDARRILSYQSDREMLDISRQSSAVSHQTDNLKQNADS